MASADLADRKRIPLCSQLPYRPPMDSAALRAEILRLGPWHHDVEVAPGVRTGDPPPPGHVWPAEFGAPVCFAPEKGFAPFVHALFEGGFAGRSFLDCGCNGGGYLYAAKAAGAGRVFGFDVREHWIEQARFLGRHLPGGEDVETAVCDLADLPAMGLEPFDVTLFGGLFYHLPDPVAGLRIAADLTREILLVNTATIPQDGDALVLSMEGTTQLMSGVHRLAWLPTNEKVLAAILAWCGFPHARLAFESEGIVPGWRRMGIVAARDESSFERLDRFEGFRAKPFRAKKASLARRALERLARKL